MYGRTTITECFSEDLPDIPTSRKIKLSFGADEKIQLSEDAVTYKYIHSPRVCLGEGLFYRGRAISDKVHSVKRGNILKAIRARRKKNKNKKTHR